MIIIIMIAVMPIIKADNGAFPERHAQKHVGVPELFGTVFEAFHSLHY